MHEVDNQREVVDVVQDVDRVRQRRWLAAQEQVVVERRKEAGAAFLHVARRRRDSSCGRGVPLGKGRRRTSRPSAAIRSMTRYGGSKPGAGYFTAHEATKPIAQI